MIITTLVENLFRFLHCICLPFWPTLVANFCRRFISKIEIPTTQFPLRYQYLLVDQCGGGKSEISFRQNRDLLGYDLPHLAARGDAGIVVRCNLFSEA